MRVYEAGSDSRLVEERLLSSPNLILVLKSRGMGPDRERRGEER
jgi:hypothetical protein